MLLLLMGVEDEVKEIEDIDMDALEGKNVKENFRAKLKSGRILDVKSGIVRLI